MLDGFDRATSGRGEFPPVEVWSGEQGLKLLARLPGIETKDVEVSVVGDVLTLKGARAEDGEQEGEAWHRRERGSGRFARSFQLPFQVEADEVRASMRDGVLEVLLPRAASEKPRRIAVETA
jgi:HSP20 family protein